MKRLISGLLCFVMIASLMSGAFGVMAASADEEVQAVIDQLNAIDTLQEMQDKRNEYTADKHYDASTTDPTVIAAHESARTQYETYVAMMFAARAAALQAYNALTPAQQAQIDPALVAKLDNYLPTVFHSGTYTVTPSYDAYTFEAVNGGPGYGYEASNYMVYGNIPQTFILVDTSDGKTSWTPDGLYTYGQSNYDVGYCCDVETSLEYGTDYKRMNLEDSGYFGSASAKHVRAILLNSYPYVSVEQMKANLKAAGVDAQFADSLGRAELISAVQMSIWLYANSDVIDNGDGYLATIDIPKNNGYYFTVLHDYTNEIWDWLPGKKQRTYDARAAYRVETLAYYLCSLPGVAAGEGNEVISDVSITRADCIQVSEDKYSVGMYVNLNTGAGENDDLKITITSYKQNADGSVTVTSTSSKRVDSKTSYPMYVYANYGDTIKVEVEGTQYVGKSVYFYEPRGGRDVSQSLVAVGEGETAVYAEEVFTFEEDIDMGLRLYKTAKDTGYPLSEITFHVYKVDAPDGVGEKPTEEEIARYAVPENLVGSIVTDATGYAFLALEKGLYMVVEEHNAEKIVAPVDPFYVTVPMPEEKEIVDEDGETVTEIIYNDIVTVYPKNEPVVPPPPPPPPPPYEKLYGSFTIVKHETNNKDNLLEGARFTVYRAATQEDTDAVIVSCGGVEYSVVPYLHEGAVLELVTNENGAASSPQIPCGTYFIVETKAPAGYVASEEAVVVTVTPIEVSAIPVLYIGNDRGSILPETGGEGIMVMLACGAVLAVVSVVVLVTRRRMAGVNVEIEDDDLW